MKNLFYILAFAALLSAADAAATENVIVTCKQRWPWNGKVDIDYTLPPSSETSPVYSVKFYGKDENGQFPLVSLEGEGACGIVLSSGSKRVTWDSSVDRPGTNAGDFKIGAAVEDITSKARYLYYSIEHKTMTPSLTPPDVSIQDVKTKMIWFRRIEPATFVMGSQESETGHFDNKNNEAQHSVTLTKAFYLSIFEVTQGQFVRLTGENPSMIGRVSAEALGNADNSIPVNGVSYAALRGADFGASWPNETDYRVDQDSYLGKIRKHARNGFVFDIPTEAQWECACRAGTETTFNDGSDWLNDTNTVQNSDLDRLGWYRSNANGALHSVGQKLPNNYFLFDMHGNVWEWCLDNYAVDNTSYTLDPAGPANGNGNRMVRGGAYDEWAVRCRSARRMSASAKSANNNKGFRLMLTN